VRENAFVMVFIWDTRAARAGILVTCIGEKRMPHEKPCQMHIIPDCFYVICTVLSDVDPKVLKQMEVTDGSKVTRGHRAKRKKRELRVFVSSTFRDFKREREHLIKKTFREV
jgi:hypothetical protein